MENEDQNINPNTPEDRIIPINIEDEMKTAYIDYSMSVIVSRAIPDVRDGLKPVQRRVLFGMLDLGMYSNRPYKKSARVVGEVLGKYHPHGDSSVYEAMVRMAQEWSLRYPLVDGQGNFGSIDNDPPAAMRYTEVRMNKIAEEIISDIDKDTVDFQLNFDDTLKEPMVMPSRIPNLLINGSSGIAVGMATNILPHNLTEVCDGIIAYIENKEITTAELMRYIKAPDFPTGGVIYGYDGVRESFETGRGKVVLRGVAEIEENANGKSRIVITEIPYQVNKALLITKIAELVNNKEIEGISDVRDVSDRNGITVYVDLKRDAIPNVVLNQLYNFTPLQSSFGVNNIALVGGRPKLLSLREMIKYFVEFRHEVVIRRTKYELAEAEKRAHILEGLLIALDHLDEVIALIRASQTPEEAKEGLVSKFSLSEIQAKAILEMRLQRLTGLERDKIKTEYDELLQIIEFYKSILGDEQLRFDIIRDEIKEIKEKYGDARRTLIVHAEGDINILDLIEQEEVAITVSHMGYVKRTSLMEFKTQNRGGKGSKGGSTRDEDFIEHLFIANTHNYLLCFTEQGRCYWMKAYEVPEGAKTGKGRAIQNLLNIPVEDKVVTFINVKSLEDQEFINNNFIVFITEQGTIKKTVLEEFSRPRQNGINAINILDGDRLLAVAMTNGKMEIMLALASGNANRFPETKVRSMGRSAAGVIGMQLEDEKDKVIGMICVDPTDTTTTVMVVSEKGFGKRTTVEDYRITNRGGKGVKTINVTEKTGALISILNVTEEDDLMIINKSGLTIRMEVANIKEQGRATQGVTLIRLNEYDEIASVAKIDRLEIADDIEQNENGSNLDNSVTNNNGETTPPDTQ